ncbi:MAG: glutamate--tRNA ligase [Gemmatimonadota bacterium]|nr:glutamate--tRNA ligase [Gemmatimonadota bacterium]
MSQRKPVLRFAPSPTGDLHIGGARTALFNYLLARHQSGSFLLRIEDTDCSRSTPEAVEAILDGLKWLGLEWDGEIVFQSRGRDRHLDTVRTLVNTGAAYRCFCTVAELEKKRELARANKQDFIYDRTCLGLDPNEAASLAEQGRPHVVRFRIPDGETAFDDGVHGRLRFDNRLIEDFVILRTDGTPTYQLAVVADDIHMGITHILRGDDHISNTPKQILLFRALDAGVPEFSHVPLILGPDKKRLSKRHGATSLIEYSNMGFLPEAVFNFLALLGWSPGDDTQMLTRRELIARFSLEGINKGSAIFDQKKLEWLSGRYFSAMEAGQVFELAAPDFMSAGLISQKPGPEEKEHLLAVLELVKQRCRLRSDLLNQSRYFFPGRVEYDEKAVAKHWKAGADGLISSLKSELLNLDQWSEEPLEATLRSLAGKLQVSAGKLIHPLRVALTGMAVSPGIFEVMAMMGRELVLERLDDALECLQQSTG